MNLVLHHYSPVLGRLMGDNAGILKLKSENPFPMMAPNSRPQVEHHDGGIAVAGFVAFAVVATRGLQ